MPVSRDPFAWRIHPNEAWCVWWKSMEIYNRTKPAKCTRQSFVLLQIIENKQWICWVFLFCFYYLRCQRFQANNRSKKALALMRTPHRNYRLRKFVSFIRFIFHPNDLILNEHWFLKLWIPLYPLPFSCQTIFDASQREQRAIENPCKWDLIRKTI